MGIVNIDDELHDNLRRASGVSGRSINAQAEHWMRIGMLAELHPNLDHTEICRMLVRAELEGGLELKRLCGLADSAPTLQSAGGVRT